MATKKIDPVKEITTLAQDFIKDLGVPAEVVIEKVEEEGEAAYRVNLQGEDLGILIGYHGETLNALQLILSLIVSKKLGNWTRLTLDAGDWRERRGETLSEMALRAAEKVRATGEEQALPIMSSADRRLVHIALQGENGITTESTGEEGYRRVVIKPA